MKKIQGIFPPVATPFDADGNVSTEHFSSNLTRLAETGLHGFVVFGSNGESVMLSKQEKLRVLETARAAIPKERLLIAGTGVESVQETLDLTKRAAELGADFALVIMPHFYRTQMNAQTWTHYYLTLADASPLPILIYNVPANTNVDIEAGTVVELARHENIVGIKDSSANVTKMGEIVRYAPAHFSVLVGTGSAIFPALAIGANGAVPALGNIAPRECVKLFDLFHAGKWDDARNLQLKLIRANAAVTSKWGVPGLKAALEEVGYYGGLPRPPLLPLGESERTKLREILREAELIKE